ncbi:Ankyrin repeat domain-containing protein [Heracleum sosnowskyi]|uniref:Ankyrin repeat domain-containing protein n=1 Tax=Heracleum sosnowskyi TaxID=360622 RepID=A0AAD8MDW0_9APIA|nr:Ankyrin repeat domain-containing protein [Heracleum sosnowskyi]
MASLAISTNRNLLFTPKIIHTPIHTTSSLYNQTPLSFLNLRCFTSKNTESPNQLAPESGSGRPKSPDGEDFSKEALKAQIERYLAGDAEAIPDIFEGILKRKLAGKHDESDDELLQDLRQIPINSDMDKDVSDEDTSDGVSSDADDIGTMTPDSDADEFYKSD